MVLEVPKYCRIQRSVGKGKMRLQKYTYIFIELIVFQIRVLSFAVELPIL